MANLPATGFVNAVLGLISILGGWTFLLGVAAWAVPCAAQETPEPEPTPVRQLTIANKPWTGDFDRLLERRMIRVLVPYSRTLFFNDKGRERGLTADLVREFEQYVNQKHRTGNRPVTVYLIPTTRDQLLQHVADGLGDIAAGNLTLTPARQRLVDFVVEGTHTVRNNVELVVAEKVGIEPTTYVRNIYKYYVSHKLALEADEVRRKAREAVQPDIEGVNSRP